MPNFDYLLENLNKVLDEFKNNSKYRYFKYVSPNIIGRCKYIKVTNVRNDSPYILLETKIIEISNDFLHASFCDGHPIFAEKDNLRDSIKKVLNWDEISEEDYNNGVKTLLRNAQIRL